MSQPHRSFVGYFVRLLIVGLLGHASARATCYRTPSDAVDSMKSGSSLLPTSGGGGYQVTSIQLDTIQNQRWAMISSCEHPERPSLSLKIGTTDSNDPDRPSDARTVPSTDRSSPLIHAGDTVRLWRQEAVLRIELSGIAEENGTIGKSIRVRSLRRSTDDSSTQSEFTGIVRGRSDVEMQP
jgi:hypothetical protein